LIRPMLKLPINSILLLKREYLSRDKPTSCSYNLPEAAAPFMFVSEH
jgi:hypothetical protein